MRPRAPPVRTGTCDEGDGGQPERVEAAIAGDRCQNRDEVCTDGIVLSPFAADGYGKPTLRRSPMHVNGTQDAVS
jgi:hypothetical protein